MAVIQSDQPTILLVGSDAALSYLIQRYARRSGFQVHVESLPTMSAETPTLRPAVVWFLSLESLAASRPRDTGLVSEDTPLVVCSSVVDEVQARKFGADYCAVHPLTYADFLTALSAVGVAIQ